VKFWDAVKETLKENFKKLPNTVYDIGCAVLLVVFLFLPVFLVASGFLFGMLATFFVSIGFAFTMLSVAILIVVQVFWFVFWIEVLSKMENKS